MNLDKIIDNIINNDITHIISLSNITLKGILTKSLLVKNLKSVLVLSTDEEAKTLSLYNNSLYLSNYEDITKSNIIYSNINMIKNLMLSYFNNGQLIKDIDFCHVLILDDYDIGNIECEVILSLWVYALNFQDKFKIPKIVVISKVPMNITDKEYTFTIENSIKPKINYVETKDILNKVVEIVQEIVKNRVINKDIIIFVSGKREISKVYNLLYGLFKKFNIVQIYNASNIQINKFTKNIIITNNTFELLNLLDVGFIIDTMYEQIKVLNNNDTLRYANKNISKDTANKRSNYIKYTNGICYRLCSESTYNTLLDNNIPEIKRIPINDVIIELINYNLNPQEVLLNGKNDNVIKTIDTLIERNLINNDMTEITLKASKIAYELELSNNMIDFIWLWVENNYPIFWGIVISCIIDCYSSTYIYLPKWDIEEFKLYKTKHSNIIKGDNDLEVWINIFNKFLEDNNNNIKVKDYDIAKWSKKYDMNNLKIHELISYVIKCYDQLTFKLSNYITIENIDANEAYNKSLPILEEIYKDMIFIKLPNNMYKNLTTKKEHKLDFLNFYKILPNRLLALSVFNKKIILSVDLPSQSNYEPIITDFDMDNFTISINNIDELDEYIELLDTIEVDNIFTTCDNPKYSIDELIDELDI
jgi:hypothetical protein